MCPRLSSLVMSRCGRAGRFCEMYYSQNLRTFEELYDRGYIKADTHGVTQSMLGGELLGSSLLRAVLTLCLCLGVKCMLYVSVAVS